MKNSKKHIINLIEMYIGITVLCAGCVMGINAGLGQTTSTSVCSALSEASGIKVGTVMQILYGSFFVLQVIFYRKSISLKSALQLLPVLIQGVMLNFFKYDFPLFQTLFPQSYPAKFLLFSCGVVFISFGFTVVKCCNITNYPPEAFCALTAQKIGIRFGSCKIILDILYVATALTVCFVFDLGFGIVREGTLIFALVNGVLINFFQPKVEKVFAKLERQSQGV